MSQSSKIFIALATLACLVVLSEAKLLRRQRYYDDIDGGFGGSPYGGGGMGAMPTGERAIMTVRGARNPYDGSAPSKIAIEDNPYRGPYPRGVYDRLEGGRPPMYPGSFGGMGGMGGGRYGMDMPYGGGSANSKRRADFLDPDFGVKASLNLAGSGRRRSKCRVRTEADSEIPELGLDSGRLSVDCDVNPARVADVAYRAAQMYGQYRREQQRGKRYQTQPSRIVKRKRTQIQINRDYERARVEPDDQEEEDED